MATDNVAEEGDPAGPAEEDDGVRLSVGLSAVGRLLLPTVLLLLAINYVNVTWGRIQWPNLRYPYFVLGVMSVFILWVYVDELRELYAMDRDRTTAAALREFVNEWRRSILFGAITVLYVALIPVLGFFTASFLAMTSIMYAGGVRNYKLGLAITLGILALVWIMFVEVVGINPPDGLIDALFI